MSVIPPPFPQLPLSISPQISHFTPTISTYFHSNHLNNHNYVTKFQSLTKIPLISHSNHLNHHHFHTKFQSLTKIPLNSHKVHCFPTDSTPIDEDESALHEGISDILLEAGLSAEEASKIASNSPKYGKMLREGVRDLDELSMWGPWLSKNGGEGKMTILPPVTLREKVKCIAREKGDLGKIPFLESVGLSLSNAVHLARVLSNVSLTSLIYKVNYVKELFFSGNDDKLVGKHARRMMLHLSISVDEDVQQTLSFFEKIDARRGGLDKLGCCDSSFRYLIESFPRLLLLSVESHMKPVVKFLEKVGVPKERVGNVLLLYPTLLFLDIKEDIKAKSWIFEKTGSMDRVGKMLVKYPWVLSTSVQKNYGEIVALLETKKVPKDSIDRAIKNWPLLLGCSADKLKPMLEELDELGVRTTKLGKVIATSPQLLLRRNEEFWTVVSFLQDMGFDKGSIGKILARCPEIFAVRNVTTLQKKLEFLTGFGILDPQHCRIIKKYPEFFVSDIDNTVMPRVRYLMKWGLSQRAVASMVVRFSPLLGYSIDEVLRPKMEFLVNNMGKPVKEVLDYPSLEDMLSKNDEEFASDYLGMEKMFISVR
ncbi:hypothetical protein vseg_010308 [Gypsophila vaccaria]